MLKCNHQYLFQLVNQRDGCRSQPFISDPVEMKLTCSSMDDGERNSVYVLVLMDVNALHEDVEEVQKIAYNFPLMLVASFLKLNFNDNTMEASNG